MMNILAIVVSTVAYVVIGIIWFNVFRQPYLAGLGKTAEELQQGPSLNIGYLSSVVSGLIIACFFSWIIAATGAQTLQRGMMLAIIVWLCTVCTVLGPMYIYQSYSFTFFLINAGYPLLGFLAIGAIVGAWK